MLTTEEKLDLMRMAGADHVIDYTSEDFTTNGRRYDLILDIVDERSVLYYRRSLLPGGRYVLIARTLFGFVQAFLVGAAVSLAGSKRMGIFVWKANQREDLEVIKGLIDNGKVAPIIDRRFGLSEVPRRFPI